MATSCIKLKSNGINNRREPLTSLDMTPAHLDQSREEILFDTCACLNGL